MKTIIGVSAAIVLLAAHANAQRRVDIPLTSVLPIQSSTSVQGYEGRPPLDAVRVSGQVLGGVSGGLVGALLGAMIDSDCHGFICIPASVALGALAGYTGGTAAGVYFIGTLGDQDGSFRQAYLGAVLGIPVQLLAWYGLESAGAPPAAGYVAFLVPPIVSTIFFNSTRSYSHEHERTTAILTIRDESRLLSIPVASVRAIALPQRAVGLSVDVVSVGF
jgi:hypothetical protein